MRGSSRRYAKDGERTAGPRTLGVGGPSGDALALDRYWIMLGDPLVEEFVARAQLDNLDIAQAAPR